MCQAQPSAAIRIPQSKEPLVCPKDRKTSIRTSNHETHPHRDHGQLFHSLLNFLFKNLFCCSSLYHIAWCWPLFCEHLLLHLHFIQDDHTTEVNLPFFLIHEFSSNKDAELFGVYSLTFPVHWSLPPCPVPPVSPLPPRLTKVPTPWPLIWEESLQPFLVDWNNPTGLLFKKIKVHLAPSGIVLFDEPRNAGVTVTISIIRSKTERK